jgi:hypothetical protein
MEAIENKCKGGEGGASQTSGPRSESVSGEGLGSKLAREGASERGTGREKGRRERARE